MKYIIDEEELNKLVSIIGWGDKTYSEYLEDFLKSKQPIELVASGEVPYSNIGIHEYYPAINNFTGKQVEIYIKEIK